MHLARLFLCRVTTAELYVYRAGSTLWKGDQNRVLCSLSESAGISATLHAGLPMWDICQ